MQHVIDGTSSRTCHVQLYECEIQVQLPALHVIDCTSSHMCLVQLYECIPQVLLPVLPHLHAELEAHEEEHRLPATELLVALLCVPDSDIVDHFPKLAEVRGMCSVTLTV